MLEALDSAHRSLLRACLLGTAIGDALGLPYEGLSREDIAARRDPINAFRLFGRVGFVSDDTELSALMLASVLEGNGDVELTRRSFRQHLLFWFLRLPFGIGLATLRACLAILFGRKESGVASAGNGAAMRAAVLGICFRDDPARRRALSRALARVTHTDTRAVEGAVFVAELAALCAEPGGRDRASLVMRALDAVEHGELRAAIEEAVFLALLRDSEDLVENTGYVLDTLRATTWAFVRHGQTPLDGMRAIIQLGGDTDTGSAIVGGLLATFHGEKSLPKELIDALHDGPFGPSHLRSLAAAVGEQTAPRFSHLFAFARNLALYPVVLAHGLLRLVSMLDPLA